MTTNTAAPAIGPSAWVKQVRDLAPGQVPFLLQLAVEAYECGVSPEQFVDALPELPAHEYRDWVASINQTLSI
jgi:hypothetical protein